LERKGLTLPEVLVVATILLILVGLTIPIINAAKKSAKVSQSTAQLHQLAVAHTLYVQDYDNQEPTELPVLKNYVKSSVLWKSPLDEWSGFNLTATSEMGTQVSYFWSNKYLAHFDQFLPETAIFVDILIGDPVEYSMTVGQIGSFKGKVLRANRDTSVVQKHIPHTCMSGDNGTIVGRTFWRVFTDADCPPNICPAGSFDCEP